MPIFDLKGLVITDETNLKLITGIKTWVSSIESLDIEPENVFPRIYKPGFIIQENSGELVTVEILELFTVGYNNMPRTTKTRKEICEALKAGFNQFIGGHRWAKEEVKPKSIVIVTNMKDRDALEYFQWNPLLDIEMVNSKSMKSSGSGFFCGVEE
ncbi:MAG: hypothetical protein ACKUBY_00085 [Candidatus Moraniibacteriota bacterium]|jgi:hypothetical protein